MLLSPWVTAHLVLTTMKCILRYLETTMNLGLAFLVLFMVVYLFMPSLTLTWLIVLTLSTSFLVFVFSWTSSWSTGYQETTYSVLLKGSIWQSVTTSSLHWNHLDNTPLRAPCSYHLACQNSTLKTLISNTYMASSPIFHAHARHIELDCHFIHKFFLSDSHNV